MTKRTTTTTRRRQRRHTPTTGEQLSAMPDRQPMHVPLDRCPGLPGIQMNGAHVFRYEEDGETLCTRCDLPLPHGLCLACGQTLYVSKAWGDLRDATSGEARCTGRLMRADAQPSHPYTGTAHVLRADDPLLATIPKPTKGKAPSPPEREMRPGGLVCTTCRRFVVVGEGHAPDCSYKARSIAYNAELHERLLRADALAAAERERRDARNAERRAAEGDDDERPARARRERAPRQGGGTLTADDLCSGSSEPVQGEVMPAKTVGVAVCHVCGRRVPVSKKGDLLARHRLNRKRTPVPGVDVPDETLPDMTEDERGTYDAAVAAGAVHDDALDAVASTKPRTRKPKVADTYAADLAAAQKREAATKRTRKASPKPKRTPPAKKRNGRSALSAKAVVHAMKGATPACGASIATITKTADAVTCKTCVAQLAATD